MNQREVMEALLAGKKIKSKDWSASEFIQLSENFSLQDEKGNKVYFSITDENKMEIYTPPKQLKTKTMWQAVLKDTGGSLYTSRYLFECPDDFKNKYDEEAVFGRIKIEVQYEE